LGRLKVVTEDPSGAPEDTTYAYDVLDNLLTVKGERAGEEECPLVRSPDCSSSG
jgi:hypothetical protein